MEQLTSLIDEYIVKNKKSYVVSISRKGPKVLKLIDTNNTIKIPFDRVISEHALPFFFNSFKRDFSLKEKIEQIVIVDDAVYYGTTIEGIYNEIKLYLKQLDENTETKILLLSAIKDNNAKYINEIQSFIPKIDEKPVNGYGHFFIKELMHHVNNMNSIMEVEFPIIHFELKGDSKNFTTNNIINALQKEFGEEYVYDLTLQNKTSYNIILTDLLKDERYDLAKIRYFIDYENDIPKTLKVTPITPCAIDNDEESIKNFFSDMPDINLYWERIYNECISFTDIPTSDIYGYADIQRNRKRSLVILINYIISFINFTLIYDRFVKVFNGIGYNLKYNGIERNSLEYLTGSKDVCFELTWMIEDIFLHRNKDLEIKKINIRKNYEETLFERKDYPKEELKETYQYQTKKLLGECHNLQEALSAIFFNQNAILEKKSREHYDIRRLHLGQTFFSIKNYITNFCNFNSQNEKLINKWIDRRIDQGSIVPQYIKDYKSGLWRRVFRPGENEDTILNHLSRFILFVMDNLSSELEKSAIPKEILNNMLKLLIDGQSGDKLMKAINISMRCTKIDETQNSAFVIEFINDDQTEGTDLIDYLERMNILTEDNEYISIEKQLIDKELIVPTILDDITQEWIREKIKDVSALIIKKYKCLYQPYLVFNHYFLNDNDITTIKEKFQEIKTHMIDFIKMRKEMTKNNLENSEAYGSIIEKFQKDHFEFKQYLIEPHLYETNAKMKNVQMPLHKLKNIYDVIVSIYFFRSYIRTNVLIRNIKKIYSEDQRMKEWSDFTINFIEPTKFIELITKADFAEQTFNLIQQIKNGEDN